MQAVEITLWKAWMQLKRIFINSLLSLTDEGGENKIYQFFSLFLKVLRQGGLSFYGSHKGDEGADTDLTFQCVT